MRMPSGHNRSSRGKRNLPLLQQRDEALVGRLGQKLLLARLRTVENAAVLHDHAIKELQVWKDLAQVGQMSSSHQDELASRRAHPLQGIDGRIIDLSVGCKGAVVIRRKDKEMHGPWMPSCERIAAARARPMQETAVHAPIRAVRLKSHAVVRPRIDWSGAERLSLKLKLKFIFKIMAMGRMAGNFPTPAIKQAFPGVCSEC